MRINADLNLQGFKNLAGKRISNIRMEFTKIQIISPLAPIGGSSLFFRIFFPEKSYCRKRELPLLKKPEPFASKKLKF